VGEGGAGGRGWKYSEGIVRIFAVGGTSYRSRSSSSWVAGGSSCERAVGVRSSSPVSDTDVIESVVDMGVGGETTCRTSSSSSPAADDASESFTERSVAVSASPGNEPGSGRDGKGEMEGAEVSSRLGDEVAREGE
jgi:hypothetical protein